MIRVRRSDERGHAHHGWLDSRHTFSFADYYDPEHMGFRALRVINEDRVEPGRGFATHPHRDMEILSYVLEGALEHKDSLGTGSVIRPGEVQRMSAGTGVTHSEFNQSDRDPVHFLQIWIVPERKGLLPSYEQRAFGDAERRGRLRLVAAWNPRAGAVKIHQDADVYSALLDRGDTVSHAFLPGRGGWIQVARGSVDVNGHRLASGDGAAIEDEPAVAVVANDTADILLFDLG